MSKKIREITFHTHTNVLFLSLIISFVRNLLCLKFFIESDIIWFWILDSLRKKIRFPILNMDLMCSMLLMLPFLLFMGLQLPKSTNIIFWIKGGGYFFCLLFWVEEKKIVDFLEQNSVLLLEIIRYFFKNCFMELVIRVEWIACLKLLSSVYLSI